MHLTHACKGLNLGVHIFPTTSLLTPLLPLGALLKIPKSHGVSPLMYHSLCSLVRMWFSSILLSLIHHHHPLLISSSLLWYAPVLLYLLAQVMQPWGSHYAALLPELKSKKGENLPWCSQTASRLPPPHLFSVTLQEPHRRVGSYRKPPGSVGKNIKLWMKGSVTLWIPLLKADANPPVHEILEFVNMMRNQNVNIKYTS